MSYILTRAKGRLAGTIVVAICLFAVASGIYAGLHRNNPGFPVSDAPCVAPKVGADIAGCVANFSVHARLSPFGEPALSPSGDTFYAVDQKGDDGMIVPQLVAWRISDGTELWRRTLEGDAWALAMAPKGDKVATWVRDARLPIQILSLSDGKLLAQTEPIDWIRSSVFFNGDGTAILLARHGELFTIKVREGDLAMKLPDPDPYSQKCFLNAVGTGFFGEVTGWDRKLAAILISNDDNLSYLPAQQDSIVTEEKFLDATCEATHLAFLTPPRKWPDAVPRPAVFSPDSKRLAVAYNVPGTDDDYGGLII